ncbi:hypothetical protein WJX84_010257 [Apatococcus fuscideae]|uniref:Radical SAM core domain-containing protein n=1 Tax=Apatococcus fuscideae TaxID=2026836 RepID=A0AAW1SXU3_9CHLO
MPPRRILSPLSVWDTAQVAEVFRENGIKTSHVARLYKHLIRHPGTGWSNVDHFPVAAAQLLDSKFTYLTSTLQQCQTSSNKETTKLLIRLQDGMQVEAVIMQYDTTGKGRESHLTGQPRATLCVSSQVGCQMGCTFCATGSMGLKGNLTAGEILEQLVHASAVMPIRNIVFMGMGEPLNNYAAVREAVRMMTDTGMGFGLRRSAVTVSTVGVVPRIADLAADLPGVSLALSLHAPTQELRQRIVPSAKAYKLDKLIAQITSYQQITQRRVFVEYVMLAGVNDGAEQAHQLGELLQGRDMIINLIPWNPVYSPDISFEAPAAASLSDFQHIIRNSYGLPCTIRQEKGQDISGACGQLVIEQRAGQKSPAKDIEELSRRPIAAA